MSARETEELVGKLYEADSLPRGSVVRYEHRLWTVAIHERHEWLDAVLTDLETGEMRALPSVRTAVELVELPSGSVA